MTLFQKRLSIHDAFLDCFLAWHDGAQRNQVHTLFVDYIQLFEDMIPLGGKLHLREGVPSKSGTFKHNCYVLQGSISSGKQLLIALINKLWGIALGLMGALEQCTEERNWESH